MHNETAVRFRGRPRRVLALAGTSVVLLLSSALAARPGPALPDEIPASERSQLIEVTENASLATHAAGEPFVARPEGFVYLLDHPLVEMIGKLVSAAAAAKAEKEAHQLVKVFARTTRAIDNDPAGVHELLRQRPDVPRRELEEFRQLLQLP